MISFKEGTVVRIIESYDEIDWIEIEINGEISKGVNYRSLTGEITIGDSVILNTTAVDLSLGTGGQHFVIHNKKNTHKDIEGSGHIMKLRYTPMQFKCLATEEQDSPYHNHIKDFTSLDKKIFIVGTLHSMLAPISATIKYLRPELKINYIMTDSGALPIQFSKTVKNLKQKGIIDNTITVGHSFGGDFECINIYTGIITAKEVLDSDITIITMGPGIVGTGTKYGFSGIEQGYIVDAINSLGGTSIVVPRISFRDKRNRHTGMSHHSLTILNEIIKTKTNLILPKLDLEKENFIKDQMKNTDIFEKHDISYEDGTCVKNALEHYKLKITTMGRGYDEDKEFFTTLGAVAKGALCYDIRRKDDEK
ncbi:hypothetical protein Curi_c14010 [Gottschalkia acidurici 9a]|uniref:DUF3866 domain-containing protein n=1 Tax=Gottschalkia acidurici (strain ATCC 7906 / DSM 604 / BCRC 14475 / CIP 104303 / KCTC 5404 / NCIMB 10678 / 9a) TaxID=1128398 RepID=K0B1A1_GOTA9|nr:DUF3866 family protein [Gottschalkia acidurici]AFS78411.1 hypothetical protein Curi_c14010 [Gottschalkia acidurici 9a]